MFNSPYAYVNPYQAYMPNTQPHQSQQVIKVNGRNGADTFQMSPNSSVLLLDETAPIVWLAQTDGAGYKTLTAYDISVHRELPPIDVRQLENRVNKIEEALRYVEPDTTDNKQWKPYDGTVKSNQTGSSNGKGKQPSNDG